MLDEATGKWGIRVNRVELKAVDPPASIKESMEKQMRADRDKRAAILTAEGVKQSQILTAEGEKQSAILKAEGLRQATILEAEGQAKAIDTVFNAIHEGKPDQGLLAYQYLQILPQIAQGESNKMWIIPSELTPSSTSTSRSPSRVPTSGPEGYRTARRSASASTSIPTRYDDARRDAIATLKRHPELDHDEEVWVLFTERIIQGMGGAGDTYACAVEMTRAWERAEHFELFDDALPVLDELRGHGLKLALLSNTGRDLDEFVAHHGIAGRRDPDLARPRQDEAARDDLPRDARASSSVAAGARGDGRRRSRRTTSTARARSACTRGSSTATAAFRITRTASPTCGRFPRRSGWCENPT